MSMLCTTMVDALQFRYTLRRVQMSSSFHRDTPRAAPVARRRVKHRAKRTEEGTPVQHLGNRKVHVLHDE
jgi:hypothetical protein